MFSGVFFAQGEPQLETVGKLVKATYFFENGNVQQVGFFKDGKLNGTWTSYYENGSVKTIAEYENGQKSGNWKFFDNAIASKEVKYANNEIVAINVLTINALAKN